MSGAITNNVMISIIIPAYNEENRIRKTLNDIISFFAGKDYEVIVSANGCRDKTEDIIKEYSKNYGKIRLISSDIPGKGMALQRGFDSSNGNIIIFADADSSSGPEELWKLVRCVEKYDAVIGSRTNRELIKIRQPFKREVFGKFMSLLVRFLFRIDIKDTQCGYKAFRREVLENTFHAVKSKGFEFDVELLVKIKRAGFTIKELPVVWNNDPESKLRVFPDAIKMFYNLIKFRVLL